VRYHHAPTLSPENTEAVQLVYLCDLIAIMIGIGGGADGLSYHAYDGVMKQYQLKEKDVERFMILLDDRFQLVKETLGVR